jgi:hypothetical protein
MPCVTPPRWNRSEAQNGPSNRTRMTYRRTPWSARDPRSRSVDFLIASQKADQGVRPTTPKCEVNRLYAECRIMPSPAG